MQKPIKSRQGLTRCAACRAHIHAAERPSQTDCPFCGANGLRPSAGPRPSSRGGLLAAALFAFGASACGGGAAEEETTVEPVDDTGGEDTGDGTGDGTGGGTGDGADDGTGGDDEFSGGESDPSAPVALYGVAP